MDHVAYVVVNGHKVDPRFTDFLHDGKTGQPISDAEYDEQLRRIREHDPEFRIPKVV